MYPFKLSGAALGALLLAAAVGMPCHAQQGPAANLQAELAQQQSEQKHLLQDLERLQSRLRASQEELQQLEDTLQERENQFHALQARIGGSDDHADQERLRNERQRLELAKVGRQTRLSAVSRLERQEHELQQAITSGQNNTTRLENAITRAQARSQRRQREERRALAEQLEALQQENERLKQDMQEEQLRAEEAALEAALAAEQLEKERLEALKAAAEQSDASNKKGLLTKIDAEDPSQMVLDDEPPIYQGDDGGEVVMRSRSIEHPLKLQAIAPGQYRGEVEVTSGRAFFDVLSRRYRGHFDSNTTYIFYYDEDESRLSVQPKVDNGQVAGQSPL